MAGELLLRTPDGRVHTITAPARLGRDVTCQIHLDDGLASRVHATVWPEGPALRVRDEGSSNGTFFNGERLEPNRVYNLRPGDQLRVGQTTLVVERAPEGAAAPAPRPAPVPPPPTPTQLANIAGPATVHMSVQPRPAPAAPPARRRSALPLIGLGGCALLLLVLICGAAGLFALQRPPMLQTALAQFGAATPGVEGTLSPEEIHLTILATSPPPTPITPAAFVANQQSLAQAVADLNQAELDLIHKALAQAPAPRLSKLVFQFSPITEADFALLGQEGIQVGVMAVQQGMGLSAQGDGNDIASQAMAEVFGVVAQQGFAVAVKVDELRVQWINGELGAADLAAQLAQASAVLWNPAVTEPGTSGNPFAAYAGDPAAIVNPAPLDPADLTAVNQQLGLDTTQLGWLAVGPDTGAETLTLPPLDGPLAEPLAPNTLVELLAPGSPLNAEALAQVAGALLGQAAGQPGQAGTITIPVHPIVVADPQTAAAGGQQLPAFPGGQMVIISQSDDNKATTLLGLDGSENPAITVLIPIEEKPPVVALTISNLTITNVNRRPKDAFNTFEADVQYTFDVQWQSNLVAPQFALDCVSGNHYDITSASGTQHISAKGLLILYPGAEDAFCYASRNGNTLGSASVHFLVGDAAEATQRAIQVETDSVSLDLTLTADEVGTRDTRQTQAASTQSVQETANALETEVAGTRQAEVNLTATAFAKNENEGAFATQTAAALTGDSDGDGVTNANDRCFDQQETRNGWRDDDGCPDVLPNVNLSVVFTERLTNGPVNNFATSGNLLVNFSASTTTGTLNGGTSWTGTYICYNTSDPSETYQTVAADYNASYTGSITGSADGASKTYTGEMFATGVTHITPSEPFTHEECTHLNGQTADDHWVGTGAVNGAWDGSNIGTLVTAWNVDDIQIAGSWSGTAVISDP